MYSQYTKHQTYILTSQYIKHQLIYILSKWKHTFQRLFDGVTFPYREFKTICVKDKNGVCVEGMKIGKEIEQYFPQVYLILNISG